MNRIAILLLAVIMLSACTKNGAENEFQQLRGAYLGQTPPGNKPELFAPGFISTGLYTRDLAIMPDGSEFYYCISVGNFTYATIVYTRMENGIWTRPRVAPYMDDPNVWNFEPCISHDGKKLFFLSNRPDSAAGDSAAGDQDIWVMDRINESWSKPYNLGPPVNSENEEYFPSITRDGTLYFTRNQKGSRLSYIYRSRLKDGQYQEPERLGAQVNSGRTQYNAFIAPDESYIIVPTLGREDSFGSTDYYISFRNPDDTWTGPVNMGEKINTPRGTEYSPYISPDGKYFFFMSVRTKKENTLLTYDKLWDYHTAPQHGTSGIYWVDTGFIEDLKRIAYQK